MGDAPKLPPTFKSLLPFVRRADELERDTSRPESKLIAYFCRQYAMELGIKLRENDTSNEATNYLLSLMDRLEGDKADLPTFTQDEGKEICEDFALEIFSKADDEDRAGAADKNTARTFYAAGTFFDILNQFGDISEDIIQKRRYCKYKAATILKAIKEGRTPDPGPPGEGYATGDALRDELPAPPQDVPTLPEPPTTMASSMTLPSTVTSAPTTSPLSLSAPPPSTDHTEFPSFTAASYGPPGSFNDSASTNYSAPSSGSPLPSAPVETTPRFPSPPSAPVQAPAPPSMSAPIAPPTVYNPIPQSPDSLASTPTPAAPPRAVYAPPPSSPPMPSAPSIVSPRAGPVTQAEINDAMECAKFAVAALKVNDIQLATQRLEMALRSLR